MSDVDADVWVLTETKVDFEPAQGFKLAARSLPASDLKVAKGECWVAIWVRKDKAEAEAVALEVEQDRQAAVSVCGWGRRRVLVIGTVLPWNTDPRLQSKVARGAATFCKVLAEQAAEWRRLQKLHSESGFCMAGDFNQDLAEKHFYGSKRGKAKLRDAVSELGLQCQTGDARDPLAAIAKLASIDHIYLGGGLRHSGTVASVAWPKPGTLDKRLTDHYGVYVDIGG